jgi:CHAT domain-containing protein
MPTAARAAGAGGPADLRAALPPKAAFVDFVWYFAPGTERPKPYLPFTRVVPRYVAFVVRPDGIDRVELGPAGPIHAQLTAWLGAIDRGDPTTAPAAAMRELVWKPIAARLPADVSVVYLAPDNALARLPWAALPGARPDTILLEDHAVALVPHGPYLLDRLIAPAQADPFGGPVLTVGGVHYGDSKARDGGPPAWRPLPGTIREADTVVALADRLGISVVRLDGLGASRKRVEEELPKSRIAHLSTHGFFADPAADKGPDAALFARRQLLPVMPAEPLGEGAKNPLVRSGLVLADANRIDPPTAGLLTADGVLNLPLDHLDLAVLSACESGLGQAVTGEGVYGLQRAFHMAGAKNVLASLWKVDDEATTALMTLFYRNLWERKLSAVESLRLAQLSLCRRTDPLSAQTGLPRGAAAEGPAAAGFTGVQTTLPARRWAAFTVSGVGPVTGASPIALDEPNTRKSLSPIALWLGIAAAVLIAMAIILAACQRARQPAEKTSPRA